MNYEDEVEQWWAKHSSEWEEVLTEGIPETGIYIHGKGGKFYHWLGDK